MAIDFAQLRAGFVDALKTAISEAAANAEVENNGAVQLQRVFRGWRVRFAIVEFSFYAREIQRVYRGHLDRRRARAVIGLRAAIAALAVKHACATSVQRVYRGYLSRRTKHDFHARKAYISAVQAQGEALRVELQARLDEQMQRHSAAEEAKAREEFERVTQTLHHLVSTKAVPGVFNPQAPSHARTAARGTPQPRPMIDGVSLEDHLRAGAVRLLRAQGYRKSGAVPPSALHAASGTIAALSGGRGGLVPSYVTGDHTSKGSLLTSVPFTALEEAQRAERRREHLTQLDPAHPFTAGGAVPLQPLPVGVHAATRFVPPALLARSTRDLANTPAVVAQRLSAAPFLAGGRIADGRTFEDVEREKVAAAAEVIAVVTAAAPHPRSGSPPEGSVNAGGPGVRRVVIAPSALAAHTGVRAPRGAALGGQRGGSPTAPVSPSASSVPGSASPSYYGVALGSSASTTMAGRPALNASGLSFSPLPPSHGSAGGHSKGGRAGSRADVAMRAVSAADHLHQLQHAPFGSTGGVGRAVAPATTSFLRGPSATLRPGGAPVLVGGGPSNGAAPDWASKGNSASFRAHVTTAAGLRGSSQAGGPAGSPPRRRPSPSAPSLNTAPSHGGASDLVALQQQYQQGETDDEYGGAGSSSILRAEAAEVAGLPA